MKLKMAGIMVLMLCIAMTLGLSGCTCVQKGAALGAGAGAGVGTAIGSFTAEAGEGALIGAGAGGLVGALIGDGMCKPEPSDEIANLKSQIAALTAENNNLKDQLAKRPMGVKCPEYVMQGDLLFASGSDKITPKGYEALAEVAEKIRRENAGRPLIVEGYTDNEPIKVSGWKSNWELGSARALAVLHYLVDKQGFPATAINGATYGEFKPLKPNDTPENRQMNRRIAIVVVVK